MNKIFKYLQSKYMKFNLNHKIKHRKIKYRKSKDQLMIMKDLLTAGRYDIVEYRSVVLHAISGHNKHLVVTINTNNRILFYIKRQYYILVSYNRPYEVSNEYAVGMFVLGIYASRGFYKDINRKRTN